MVVPSPSLQAGAIDFSELRGRYSRAEFRQFKNWARSTREGLHRGRDAIRSVFVIAVLGLTMLFSVLCALAIAAPIFSVTNWMLGLVLGLVMAAFIGLAWVRLVDIWRRDVRFGRGWHRWMHMDRFALANSMIYVPEILAPVYAGSIFTIGKARRAFDVVATTAGRYVEIGNYQFCGETGFNRSLNQCGYIRIEVDRRLPHIYLRSRRSQKLGATFARAQEFSLEGDFGNYFRLYAPGGYERDALYIFTPDLMAILIDNAAAYDIEFVDDYIYFYSHRRFDMRAPATYEHVVDLVDVVIAKALRQTGSYSDFRSRSNYVAPQGARLRRGVTVAAVMSVLLVAGQIYRVIHGF
jgi:hypothetical protein